MLTLPLTLRQQLLLPLQGATDLQRDNSLAHHVTTIPRSYVFRIFFRICPSFSMTLPTFYDLLRLIHAYNFHMLTISHAYDFTCLQLSHVNCIHMLLSYLFCTTTLYYKTPPVTSLTVV